MRDSTSAASPSAARASRLTLGSSGGVGRRERHEERVVESSSEPMLTAARGPGAAAMRVRTPRLHSRVVGVDAGASSVLERLERCGCGDVEIQNVSHYEGGKRKKGQEKLEPTKARDPEKDDDMAREMGLPRSCTDLMHSDEADVSPVVMRAIHKAALECEPEIAMGLLASGLGGGVDCLTSTGFTPLMYCAVKGCLPVAKVLLSYGANLEIAADEGVTALMLAAVNGRHAVAKLLAKAGADLEAASYKGGRALHLTAHLGDVEMMKVLIKAGANVDARKDDGSTPLFAAAVAGQVGSTRVLLGAKANPQLTNRGSAIEPAFVPLDAAAEHGEAGVVRELIETVGVKGCGGENDGVTALQLAAQEQLLDIVTLLTDSGVVDTGRALMATAGHAREAPMKFLLEKHTPKFTGRCGYPNARNPFGATPLLCCIEGGSCSPRIVRMLIDAGADTTSNVRVAQAGVVHSNGTPLDAAIRVLNHKKTTVEAGQRANNIRGGICALEATQRLLLQVEAVHSVSWLWPATGARRVVATAEAKAAEGSSIRTKKKKHLPHLGAMLPLLRRRARRRDMVLLAMSRMIDHETHNDKKSSSITTRTAVAVMMLGITIASMLCAWYESISPPT